MYLIKGKYDIDLKKIKESMYLLVPRSMKVDIKMVDELPELGQKYRPVISFVKEEK